MSSKEIEQVLSGVTLPLDLELKLLYMKAMKENASFEALHAYTEKLLFKEKFDDLILGNYGFCQVKRLANRSRNWIKIDPANKKYIVVENRVGYIVL